MSARWTLLALALGPGLVLGCVAEVSSAISIDDAAPPGPPDASAWVPDGPLTAEAPSPVFIAPPPGVATPLKVLFIGNSFSESNLLHLMFQRVAEGEGKKIVVDSYYEGGVTLERLWTLSQAKVLAKVDSNDWDFVVLQPWDAVGKDMTRWGRLFMDAIERRRAQTRTLIYMVNWEPVPKPGVVESDQRQLEAFVAQNPMSTLVPVIWAWVAGMNEQPEKARDDKPYLWLSGDYWHPGRRRTYLAAISIHTTIFRGTPEGLNGDPGGIKLSAADAAYLQGLAWRSLREHSTDPALRR